MFKLTNRIACIRGVIHGLPATLAVAITVTAQALPCTLQNPSLELQFEPQTGQLIRCTDLRSQWNHIKSSPAPTGLWELNFTCSGKTNKLEPAAAGSFRFEPVSSSRALLHWSGFTLPGAEALEVTASVALDADGASSSWGLQVSAIPGLHLDRIHYPRIPGIRSQPDERLAVPLWMGQLNRNPRKLLAGSKPIHLEWEYPGLTSLQCIAYYREQGPGFFLSSNDTNGYRKIFRFSGNTNGQLFCEWQHLPEHRTGEDYTLPYSAVLSTFNGDWFTAAGQYRTWATNQFWAHQSRLKTSASPPWVTNTALWIWNRGRSPGVIAPALALRRQLGLPVGIFWHWWHGCAYDTGFPEYLPPREGDEPFRKALDQAHDQDLHAIVYMNQRLWGMTTRSWELEGAARYAVKAADGRIRPEVYNTFTKLPCASMCMGTPFWRNKYASLAEDAFKELGVDGIYMDQACSSMACFDPDHGHPIGGGRYWVDGFKTLSADLRARCAKPAPIVLAGEGCSEGWLPYLDLMLSLQVSKERYTNPRDGWEPIPFFQAVYHPYSILYGNYSSLTLPPYDDLWPSATAPKNSLELLDRKFSRQFMMEQARSFLWGQQPAIANFLPNQLTERRREINYVLRLARIRARHLDYLLNGTLLRQPEFDVESARFGSPGSNPGRSVAKTVRLPLSRLSIYAGQQGTLSEFEGSTPTVLGAAWLDLRGNVGLFYANLGDSPLTLTQVVNQPGHPLPNQGRIFDSTEPRKRLIGRFSHDRPLLHITIPPGDVRVIELTN